MKKSFCFFRFLLMACILVFCLNAWNAVAKEFACKIENEPNDPKQRDVYCPGGRNYIGKMELSCLFSTLSGNPLCQYAFYWDWYNKENLVVDPEHSIKLNDLKKYPDLYEKFITMEPLSLDLFMEAHFFKYIHNVYHREPAGKAKLEIKHAHLPVGKAGEKAKDDLPRSPKWNELFYFQIPDSSPETSKAAFMEADELELRNLRITQIEWPRADGIINEYLKREKAEEEKKAEEERALAKKKALQQELARKKAEAEKKALEEQKLANKRALESMKLDNRTVNSGIASAPKAGASSQQAVSNPFTQTPKNITLPSSQNPPMSKNEAREVAINDINKATQNWLENMSRNNGKNLNLPSQPALPEFKMPSLPKELPSIKSTYTPSSNPQTTLDRINKINNDSVNWLNSMNQKDAFQNMMDISARANEVARQNELNAYFEKENRRKELRALEEDAKSRAEEVWDAKRSLSSQWSSISSSYKKQLNEIDSQRNQVKKAKNDLNQWLAQMETTWKKEDADNKAKFEEWEQQVEEEARRNNAWGKKQSSLEDLSRSKTVNSTPFRMSGTNRLKDIEITTSEEKGSLLKSLQKTESAKNTRGSLLAATRGGSTNNSRGTLLNAGKIDGTSNNNTRGSLLNAALSQNDDSSKGLKSAENPFMLEVRLAREKQEHREDFARAMATLQTQRQEVRQKVKARMAEYDQVLTQLNSTYKTVESNYNSASRKYDSEYEKLEKRQESLERDARRYQIERENIY